MRTNRAQELLKGHLDLKEKLAVLAMLLFLALIGATSYARKVQSTIFVQKTISVTCIGACKQTDPIKLALGSQIQDLLCQLELAPEADTSKLVLTERLKDNQLIIIPKKGCITLNVSGAVKAPGLIYVPEGLHFNELLPYLTLSQDADIGVIRRRRRQLLEGETIHIPAKSEFIVRK